MWESTGILWEFPVGIYVDYVGISYGILWDSVGIPTEILCEWNGNGY